MHAHTYAPTHTHKPANNIQHSSQPTGWAALRAWMQGNSFPMASSLGNARHHDHLRNRRIPAMHGPPRRAPPLSLQTCGYHNRHPHTRRFLLIRGRAWALRPQQLLLHVGQLVTQHLTELSGVHWNDHGRGNRGRAFGWWQFRTLGFDSGVWLLQWGFCRPWRHCNCISRNRRRWCV